VIPAESSKCNQTKYLVMEIIKEEVFSLKSEIAEAKTMQVQQNQVDSLKSRTCKPYRTNLTLR